MRALMIWLAALGVAILGSPASASVLFSSSGTLGEINPYNGPDFINNVYFDPTTSQFGFAYSDLSFKIYNDVVSPLLGAASMLTAAPVNPSLPAAHAYELRLTLPRTPISTFINDSPLYGEMTYFDGHSAGGADGFSTYGPHYVPWSFSGNVLVYRFTDAITYTIGASESALFLFPGPIEGIVQLQPSAADEDFTLTISSVAEPQEWLALIMGFAAIGLMMRKRTTGTGSVSSPR